MPAPLTKKCYSCNQVKLLDNFYHNRTKPDFHNGICKECQKIVNDKNRK